MFLRYYSFPFSSREQLAVVAESNVQALQIHAQRLLTYLQHWCAICILTYHALDMLQKRFASIAPGSFWVQVPSSHTAMNKVVELDCEMKQHDFPGVEKIAQGRAQCQEFAANINQLIRSTVRQFELTMMLNKNFIHAVSILHGKSYLLVLLIRLVHIHFEALQQCWPQSFDKHSTAS